MTSNMKIKEINSEKKTESGFNCDSFERFGDDLCELLLSYLTIREKINFECISKQWKSLKFNKQQKLIISSGNYLESYDTIIIATDFWEKNKNSIIKCLLKKFQFINELEITFDINYQLLEIINKNCQHLRKISFKGQNVRNYCEIFGQKCGQKLEIIDIYGVDNEDLVSLLRSTPNLKVMNIYISFEALIKEYLPKLEEIKVWRISSEGFEKFANLYNKQIKKISFYYWTEEWNKFIPLLSQFENLESLHLRTYHYRWNKDFVSVAKNLKHLKRLTIHTSELNETFEILKVFNIKFLEIFALILDTFKEEDLKIIKTLDLTKFSTFSGFNHLMDNSLEIFTEMKRLTELRTTFEAITDSGICHLIKNCHKLKTLHIFDKHINETTIEAFSLKALCNPKTNYQFISRTLNNKRFTNEVIPKNLIIEKMK
jgi:hypothetical protein